MWSGLLSTFKVTIRGGHLVGIPTSRLSFENCHLGRDSKATLEPARKTHFPAGLGVACDPSGGRAGWGFWTAKDYWDFPSTLQDIGYTHCLICAKCIIKDSTHPHHEVFSLLASGNRSCSLRHRHNTNSSTYHTLTLDSSVSTQHTTAVIYYITLKTLH